MGINLSLSLSFYVPKINILNRIGYKRLMYACSILRKRYSLSNGLPRLQGIFKFIIKMKMLH